MSGSRARADARLPGRAPAADAGLMLALATVGFARDLLGVGAALARSEPPCASNSSLTAFQQSLLVAVPVIVGSLGRIPVGALTDRLGRPADVPDRRRS